MAKFVLRDAYIAINGTAISDHVSSVTVEDSADEVDFTAFSANAYREFGQGLKDGVPGLCGRLGDLQHLPAAVRVWRNVLGRGSPDQRGGRYRQPEGDDDRQAVHVQPDLWRRRRRSVDRHLHPQRRHARPGDGDCVTTLDPGAAIGRSAHVTTAVTAHWAGRLVKGGRFVAVY
jgi:hypothetical protein